MLREKQIACITHLCVCQNGNVIIKKVKQVKKQIGHLQAYLVRILIKLNHKGIFYYFKITLCISYFHSSFTQDISLNHRILALPFLLHHPHPSLSFFPLSLVRQKWVSHTVSSMSCPNCKKLLLEHYWSTFVNDCSI